MSATRLPGKPLADIHGEPMIVHVWRRAMETGIGNVLVAADTPEIVKVIEKAGGQAVMTSSHHMSGSDRIYEALMEFDPNGHHDIIVNIQGDLPTLDPKSVAASILPLADEAVDMTTLCALITQDEERSNPNVVKLIGSHITPTRLKALYFTRATAPWGEGPLYHHIGLYAYRRRILEKFINLKPSTLELREKLEQLRALEAGIRIDAVIVDTVPLGVDTMEDLMRARQILSPHSN